MPNTHPKVAVITGGGSGIGRRTLERAVEQGWRVVLADIRDAPSQAVAARLGDAVRFIHCDVTVEADIAAAIELAVATWGRLDLMFNNAGAGGDPSPVESMTVEGWDFTMNLLLRSVMLGIKHATPVMKRQGGGSIVSTASVAGLVPGSTGTAYGVAKSAVVFLTKAAALELAADRIRVNCICPGLIATPIFTRAMDLPTQMLDSVVAQVAPVLDEAQPLPRGGRPDDIAEAVLWLADDRAGFVTGVALPVDGGFAAGLHPNHRTQVWTPVRAAVAAAAEQQAGSA
ncbi:MAG: SDR family oxidoreductase [Proteobacteria bacterium]|nr:SDR family oxidoreductase [Pseudomonadota bacterium]